MARRCLSRIHCPRWRRPGVDRVPIPGLGARSLVFQTWRVWIRARRSRWRWRATTATRLPSPACWISPSTSGIAQPPAWLVRAAGRPAAGSGALPERRRRAPRPPTPSPRGTAATRRRGRAAGRGRRGIRAAGQPASDTGGGDRAVVHRAGGGAWPRRRPCASRRARPAVRPGGRHGARGRRPRRGRQSDQPDRRCCTPASRFWRCAGPAGSWSSTRRSPIRFPASRSRWPVTSLPDVLVLRSLTKTWSLAGPAGRLRAGRAGAAGSADRAACALAGGHAAADAPSRRAARRRRSPKPRPARGGWRRCAPRWWPGCAAVGCRRRRRLRAVRAVHACRTPS